MRIYSMTATFGKLEHQTLTLEPGLNVIEAPNEWGKSTWCAFLVAMLYGISTSDRSKKDFLADKERYAPWSGQPMSGRMELCWQGRDITIERSSKGRIPFGQFRAYETKTNVSVPELTADNCGQTLLGVEREVFIRAGFLRLNDLSSIQAEALRRRLNALVTTGDESGASDTLAQKLKDLKNSCRHNKTGLIPQTQAQQKLLTDKLSDLQSLKEQSQRISMQEQALTGMIADLKNHQAALAYQQSQETLVHVRNANSAWQKAKEEQKQLDEACADLPTKQNAQQELQRLGQLQQQLFALQQEQETLPRLPEKPTPPACFAGKSGEQAVQQAKDDAAAYNLLCKPTTPVLLILSALCLAAAIGLAFYFWIAALPLAVLAAVFTAAYFRNRATQRRDREAVAAPYGDTDPQRWIALAGEYAKQEADFRAAADSRDHLTEQLTVRRESLMQTLQLLTQGKPLTDCLEFWNRTLALRDRQEDARQRCQQAQAYAQTLGAITVTAQPPAQPDALTMTQEQTDRALAQAMTDQQLLHRRLGQCQGQMETLGDRTVLERELEKANARLERLEDTYAALTLAQETLEAAATELQRRFAPRISARAQALFGDLTGGRYDRLLLEADLSLSAAAREEDTLHGSLWRSDGTVDQLYLALRLAVAEELTPDAPLVLDDALVRFDDDRMKAAMEILKGYGENKQVLLFTCQGREKAYLQP